LVCSEVKYDVNWLGVDNHFCFDAYTHVATVPSSVSTDTA